MNKKYALERLKSLCYDYIFALLILAIITFVLEFVFKTWQILGYSWYIIIILDIMIYFIGFPFIYFKLDGSVGKSLNDLYIESTKGNITFGRILFREIIMKQLLYLTIIGIIVEIIFFILKRETLHDYYLKTVVRKKVIINQQKEQKTYIFNKYK